MAAVHSRSHLTSPGDLAILNLLTGSDLSPPSTDDRPRKPQMTGLILQAAAMSGPGTRNHYMHGGLMYPHAQMYARCDEVPAPGWGKIDKPALHSKQAPRHVRLAEAARKNAERERQTLQKTSTTGDRITLSKALSAATATAHGTKTNGTTATTTPAELKVVCHARTRVPTPHGEVFLHVYKNNRDGKEHLAFVFDRKQLAFDRTTSTPEAEAEAYHTWIRSASLDAQWKTDESTQERIVRGAYVGRLTPSQSQPADPTMASHPAHSTTPILVRIHSECFTGETIGSQRCDCGEQLDEAFRLISTDPSGKGVVVYLRQEGRGIGLLEKVRAYNLQDLGHDTVSANLLLGHGSDMRTYDLAAAILRDLGIDQVKLLTNNPDKVAQAEHEGIRVVERVPMIPRSWRQVADRQSKRHQRRKKKRHVPGDKQRTLLSKQSKTKTTSSDNDSINDFISSDSEIEDEADYMKRATGVGMIGGASTASPELTKYLQTKIERMGHMLDMPSRSESPEWNTQPSTPDGCSHKEHSSTRHPLQLSSLADSFTSELATDPEGIKCDDDCSCHQSAISSSGSLSS